MQNTYYFRVMFMELGIDITNDLSVYERNLTKIMYVKLP